MSLPDYDGTNEHLACPQAFALGKADFLKGEPLQANPYSWGTVEEEAWMQGWQEQLAKGNDNGGA